MRCRGALQRELGLPLDPHVPIVANVGRLVEQKGSDVVAAAITKLIRAKRARGTAILGIFHDVAVRGVVADRVVDVELFAALTEAVA